MPGACLWHIVNKRFNIRLLNKISRAYRLFRPHFSFHWFCFIPKHVIMSTFEIQLCIADDDNAIPPKIVLYRITAVAWTLNKRIFIISDDFVSHQRGATKLISPLIIEALEHCCLPIFIEIWPRKKNNKRKQIKFSPQVARPAYSMRISVLPKTNWILFYASN